MQIQGRNKMQYQRLNKMNIFCQFLFIYIFVYFFFIKVWLCVSSPRYSLPQIVSFLDNKIHSIYVQDLIEGVEEMANVTSK